MKSINKKRNKSSRMRGSVTHGHGGMKKSRGSGHRGGVGMAGTGKRADQRKTLINNMKEKYFGRSSLKAKPKKYEVVNVCDLEKLANGKKELRLDGYKILGKGDIKVAINVIADGISESARDKIKSAGGKVIIENDDESDKRNEALSRSWNSERKTRI